MTTEDRTNFRSYASPDLRRIYERSRVRSERALSAEEILADLQIMREIAAVLAERNEAVE